MSMPLWFYNLAVYCAQLATLIAAGALMVVVTRLREPRLRLIYWQVLLALGLLLPAIEPWQTAPQIEQGMVQTGESVAHAGSAGIDAATLPAHAALSFSIYQLVALLLVAVLAFRLLWLAAGLVRLRQSRLYARQLGPHAAVEQFKAALGVSPSVLVSDRISSPVTFGWRAPRVLLPRKFIRMDEALQRAVLCHEFLHVRRRDWLWHVGEEVLRSLFWFHLAVGWLIAQIRLCREQLVDREVVILAGSRRDYLDALFEIASSSHTSRHAPALLFLSERHLKRRVTLILKEVTMSRKKLALALSASLGGLLLTGAVTTTLLPLRTAAAQAVSPKAPLVRIDTHFFGNPDARLTVVEFGDFQCPACRKAESVAEEVRKNLGGQVRFAYRQFPLTRIHHEAEKAAEAAECAAEQGKFWQAVNYFSDHPLNFSSAGIRHFAASLGLDEARVGKCLSSGKMAARVRQDIRDGRALGVHSVPTLFVGRTKLVGMLSYSQLHALIEQKLRESGSAEDTSPSGGNSLSVASLHPALAEGLNGLERGAPSQKSSLAPDSHAQGNQDAPSDAKTQENVSVYKDDIQRQVDQAMKQAKISEEAASKINQAKVQPQVEEAMKQAMKLSIKQQVSEIVVQQALELAKVGQQIAAKISQAEIQRQVDQATEKINKAEIRRQIEQAKRQTEQAKHQAEAARKEDEKARQEATKARQQAEKARQEAEKQRKEIKPPAPPAPPSPQQVIPALPAPPSPREMMPAPPAPPSPQGLVPHPPAPPSPKDIAPAPQATASPHPAPEPQNP